MLAVQFGFASSTRRPFPLLNGDGAADPTADPSRHADAAELVDPVLPQRANGGNFPRDCPASLLRSSVRRLICGIRTLQNPTSRSCNPRAARPGQCRRVLLGPHFCVIVVNVVIMKAQHSNLVGLFLVLSPDHEHYRTRSDRCCRWQLFPDSIRSGEEYS
jgi:hypothetical protein